MHPLQNVGGAQQQCASLEYESTALWRTAAGLTWAQQLWPKTRGAGRNSLVVGWLPHAELALGAEGHLGGGPGSHGLDSHSGLHHSGHLCDLRGSLDKSLNNYRKMKGVCVLAVASSYTKMGNGAQVAAHVAAHAAF